MYKFTFVAPTEVPQHMIDMRLTESFLQQIGGLRSFVSQSRSRGGNIIYLNWLKYPA